jgi:hypothetical protein
MDGRSMGGRLLLAALVAVLVLGGCSAGSGDRTGWGEAPAAGGGGPARDAGTASARAPGQTGAASPIRLADPAARIVRTAKVRLEVEEGTLPAVIDRATAVVTKLDGAYVASNTTVGGDSGDGVTTGEVTFRVPVAAYEQALRELKGLGRYLGEDSGSKDVSSEFVDLNAQLTAWKAQERTYLRLLERARSINDVIAIQNQLSQAQQNIERLQGQINYLDDQSARSTIVLDLTEPGGAGGEPTGLLARAWAVALDGLLRMVAGAMVLAIWSLPFLLLGAITVALVRTLRRSRRAQAAPSAQA